MEYKKKLIEETLSKVQLVTPGSHQPEKLSILVVEDSESVRMKIFSCLEVLDVNIYETDDGKYAFAMLKDNKQKIDLVLTDLNMKYMNGDELCYKIRNKLDRSDLPVIVLSSSIDKRTTVNLFDVGATDYLYKPFAFEELVARINTHLERLRLNRILTKQIRQLNDLNQMKDELLAVCSHDFRSPLQVILGYAELMAEDPSIQDHQKKMLACIKKSGEHLLEMINEILVIGKAEQESEKTEMGFVQVKEIIRSCVIDFYGIAAKKNIALAFVDIDGNPLINGNRYALARIFNNLLSNAIKFTSRGGSVSVRLERDGGRTLAVSISDTGVGIAANQIPRLFERYSDLSGKGYKAPTKTGSGLFITKELIDAHHAEIEVRSIIDVGTCFNIKFPLVDTAYAMAIRRMLN